MAEFQVIRRGMELWEITHVKELWDGTFEYEIVGRVIREDSLYYVDIPDWREKDFIWKRQPRGYQVPKGAIRAITDSRKKILQ